MPDWVSSSTRKSRCAIPTRATCCTWKCMDGPFPEGRRMMRLYRGRVAPRHNFVATPFRLVIDHLRRESLGQDPDPAGVLQAPDDIGRELARPVAPLTVPEDPEHQRGELERHLVIARQLVEQAHVLDHQVHGEIDV